MDDQSRPIAAAESDPHCSGQIRQAALDRGDFVLALTVAAVVLAVYLLTLAPGLLKADAGEMQTLAVTLGYAHPTGYPVFLLMAKGATLIPVADVPYRVNLLSAVMGAAAAAGLYLLGRLLSGRRGAAAAGAAALAVSPTFWSQAVIAEVYTSAVCIMVVVLVCLTLWQQTGRVRWLFAGACLGGLVLGVHATYALLAPAALLLVMLTPRRWKANWTAAISGAALGTAITLAAYALIDRIDGPTSYFHTVINPSRSLWGLQPEDLDSFPDRLRLCFRPPQYAGLLFSEPPDVLRKKAVDYCVNLAGELPPLWLLSAAVGIFWLGWRHWKILLLMVLAYVSQLSYSLLFDGGAVQLHYIPTYVPITVFGVAGLAALSDGCLALVKRCGGPGHLLPAVDLLAAIVGICVVGWPMLAADAWTVEGRREVWLPPSERDTPFRLDYSAAFHRQVRELVDDLEPQSVVFTGWCTIYPYYYVAHVEKGRTDLEFFQDYPHRNHFQLADSALEYVREVCTQRPVYFTGVDKRVAETFRLKPVLRGRETLYRVVGPMAANRTTNEPRTVTAK